MEAIDTKELLENGVHYGHLKKKWNPRMQPYIFMERKGIHIIDLNKTKEKLEEAAAAMRSIARSGKKILFVATKKQAQGTVADAARRVNMPYVTDRWLGGMMTNFSTIRKSVKKMQSIEKLLNDSAAENITKKERLVLSREKDKMERILGGISMLNRLPSAMYIVDVFQEHIAVKEAKKLNVTTFAMVDTNSDPNDVDFPIPANDDSSNAINYITEYLVQAIQEGLDERQKNKEEMEKEAKKESDKQEAKEKKETESDEKKPKKKRRKRKKTIAEKTAVKAKEETAQSDAKETAKTADKSKKQEVPEPEIAAKDGGADKEKEKKEEPKEEKKPDKDK